MCVWPPGLHFITPSRLLVRKKEEQKNCRLCAHAGKGEGFDRQLDVVGWRGVLVLALVLVYIQHTLSPVIIPGARAKTIKGEETGASSPQATRLAFRVCCLQYPIIMPSLSQGQGIWDSSITPTAHDWQEGLDQSYYTDLGLDETTSIIISTRSTRATHKRSGVGWVRNRSLKICTHFTETLWYNF